MNMLRRFVVLSFLLLALLGTGCSSDVKVGAIVPQTGGLDQYGDKIHKGLDLALEEINGGGGVLGGNIVLIYKDDATNVDRARQVAQELIDEDGVDMIIGGVSSAVALAIAPICEKNRVILLSPSASTPELTEAGEYIYRNYPSDIIEGTAMAKFAKDLGLERVAVFALDNVFSKGLEAVFTEHFVGTSRYREIVKTFEFRDGETDGFKKMAKEVKELAPDGIYIVSYLDEAAELITQLRAAGLKSVVMGTAALTDSVIRIAGDAAEKLVFPQPVSAVDATNPAYSAFVKAYREKYNEEPDIFSAHAYDALKLFAAAIERAQSTHPDNVKSALLGIKDYEGAAGPTDFDQNGDVVRYPRIFIVHDGRVMPYDEFVEGGGSLLAGS